MSTASAMKIPQALGAVEIKQGIVAQMQADGVPEDACEVIREGLNKTCLLNHQSYSKFSSNWIIGEGKWWVNLILDDYGRESIGGIGGSLADESLEFAGSIDPMPPDTFRRTTEQPIPQPRTVTAKKDDGVGISVASKVGRPRKMT